MRTEIEKAAAGAEEQTFAGKVFVLTGTSTGPYTRRGLRA